MIHLKPHGIIPRSYYDTKVKCVTTRKTLYAIHKPSNDHNSKTHIVCFTEQKHAFTFKEYLTSVQKQGKIIDRCTEFSEYVATKSPEIGGSKLPLDIIECKLMDAMKMCHLNYFNMYVVFDLHHTSYDAVTMYYYSFESTGYPNREYLNCYLQHTLQL
jgi:hypothetical protein